MAGYEEMSAIIFNDEKKEVNLCDCVFGDECKDEFRETDRHNVIANICEHLGNCPSNFQLAEEIFHSMKYEMAKYVIHHEFSENSALDSNLLLWLDEKTSTDKKDKLLDFMKEFF